MQLPRLSCLNNDKPVLLYVREQQQAFLATNNAA